jgi:hypothetical protein
MEQVSRDFIADNAVMQEILALAGALRRPSEEMQLTVSTMRDAGAELCGHKRLLETRFAAAAAWSRRVVRLAEGLEKALEQLEQLRGLALSQEELEKVFEKAVG